jgi:hypothetical protein
MLIGYLVKSPWCRMSGHIIVSASSLKIQSVDVASSMEATILSPHYRPSTRLATFWHWAFFGELKILMMGSRANASARWTRSTATTHFCLTSC